MTAKRTASSTTGPPATGGAATDPTRDGEEQTSAGVVLVTTYPHLLVEVLRARGTSADLRDEDDRVVRVLGAAVADVVATAVRNCLPLTVVSAPPEPTRRRPGRVTAEKSTAAIDRRLLPTQ
ncbi:hypothetical protein [Kineococcus sp. SYSU DK001]|uniref:hypothetical protein n=1 Tax=Kineococcus sp. SYSU DK001 TaxID=3383122 RepID=UPI003D7E2129